MITKYLIILMISCMALYCFMKLSSILEKRLHETSGWKTDLFVSSSVGIVIVIAIIITYSSFRLGVIFLSLLH